MTMEQIIEAGELADYKPGYPEGMAARIDSDICKESKCDKCGHNGLNCRGFILKKSYRAFVVCPNCNEAEEF
jgi:hypothetical protein